MLEDLSSLTNFFSSFATEKSERHLTNFYVEFLWAEPFFMDLAIGPL